MGSGQQLEDFWNGKVVLDGKDFITISEMCRKYGVEANYLTLFGYNKNVERLQNKLVGLKIHCVRLLGDEHRVFSENSYVWDSAEELNEAFLLFQALCQNSGIPLYGYRNLDFAFIMHNTIPDWSLPLFWKQNADWNLLMRRKNSDD